MFGRFADALVNEIRLRADEITDEVNTLYIGGGTPSVLPLDIYAALLDALRHEGHGASFDEFTVEVNPEDIVEKGEAYVEGLLKLGVNRISMGVQSFDDGILRWMNRRHDSATAFKAYSILERTGIGNISIDLIFGLSQLSDEGWSRTLDKAMSLSSSGKVPPHVSAYQLSVEPGSALAGLVDKGLWSEAPDEMCARQYDILCERLKSEGYNHYEISNFALPGYEAKHNSAYWAHVPYLGLGPGAHSFLLKDGHFIRQWNEPDLKKYIEDPVGQQGRELLSHEQLCLEKVMLGLRTAEGLDMAYLKDAAEPSVLEALTKAGKIECTAEGRIRIPERSFFISDGIISDLV